MSTKRQPKMTPTTLEILRLIKSIPRGKVATYGQIAKLAGKAHASRMVAWILHACSKSHDLPWQRVINSQGRISFKPGSAHFNLQRRLLVAEGVEFISRAGVDLDVDGWKPKPRRKRTAAGKRPTPRMFED